MTVLQWQTRKAMLKKVGEDVTFILLLIYQFVECFAIFCYQNYYFAIFAFIV